MSLQDGYLSGVVFAFSAEDRQVLEVPRRGLPTESSRFRLHDFDEVQEQLLSYRWIRLLQLANLVHVLRVVATLVEPVRILSSDPRTLLLESSRIGSRCVGPFDRRRPISA